jgi:hypothetical protein
MDTTHKKNTTGLIRKWFTRGVACMALLFAARWLISTISQNAMRLAHEAM